MQSILSKKAEVETWGLVPYQVAFDRQKKYVDEIIAGVRPQTLVFCQHPPVVTLGRGTKAHDVFAWRGETVEVNRGGRATYHGPNQLVFYPLINLSGEVDLLIRPRDLHAYMRVLEESLIEVLSKFDIRGEGHVPQVDIDGDEADATGVWVGKEKIASIGIAVRKWVTSHGMAVNLIEDPQAFQGINPCGFSTQTMTSVEELTGNTVDLAEFQSLLCAEFVSRIGLEI